MPVRGFLVLLLGALAAACASSTGAVPRPFPTPGADPADVATTPPSAPTFPGAPRPSVPEPATLPPVLPYDLYSLTGTALALQGVPYVNGGSTPHGFDCSGFVQWVYAQHGVQLPREVRDQFRVGSAIGDDEIEPGDLLFFSTVRSGPSHVAIAIGGDQFVHAPTSNGVVRVESLSSPYWRSRYVATHRLAGF